MLFIKLPTLGYLLPCDSTLSTDAGFGFPLAREWRKDEGALMKNKLANAWKGLLGIISFAFLVMAWSTVCSPAPTSGSADIRAPMLALIAGALLCVSLAPFQREWQRASVRLVVALVATGSGWFWLVGTTEDGSRQTILELAVFFALAVLVVILLLGAVLPIAFALRDWRQRRWRS